MDSDNSSLKSFDIIPGLIPRRFLKPQNVSTQNVKCVTYKPVSFPLGFNSVSEYLVHRKWKHISARSLTKAVTVHLWATQRNVNSEERELLDYITG